MEKPTFNKRVGGGVKARKEEGYVIQTYQCSMSSVERSDNSCRGEETRPP